MEIKSRTIWYINLKSGLFGVFCFKWGFFFNKKKSVLLTLSNLEIVMKNNMEILSSHESKGNKIHWA
jgi:hypothetical protein